MNPPALPTPNSSDILIPSDDIAEHCQCSICLDFFLIPVTTPCGHTFCKTCLEEYLNLKHQCPLCNSKTVVTDLVRNYVLEKVSRSIQTLREAAPTRHLFKPPPNSSSSSTGQNNETSKNIDKLGRCLQKHIFPIYNQFQTLSNELVKSMVLARAKIVQEFLLKEAQYRKNGDTARAEECSVQRIKECKNLASILHDSRESLYSQFETYLSTALPAAADIGRLNPKVFLSINKAHPEYSGTFLTCTLAPTHTLTHLFDLIRHEFESRHDPVISEIDESKYSFIVKTPLGLTITKISPHIPLVSIGYIHKATFHLNSSLRFPVKSDIPRKCYALEFIPEEHRDITKLDDYKTNYFRCITCKKNWICEQCTLTCHQGHEFKPFMLKYIPDWACCYCTKTKRCKFRIKPRSSLIKT